MRLFISINFDVEAKQNIAAVQRRLRELGQGNFTRMENLHLTLAFMGEVDSERVAVIRRILDGLTVPALRLIFDHVGSFQRDGGDIWWIGMQHNETLLALRTELYQRLANEDFHLNNSQFIPHITLARRMLLEKEPDKKLLLGDSFATNVNTISLMLSEQIYNKFTYSELYTVPAGNQYT